MARPLPNDRLMRWICFLLLLVLALTARAEEGPAGRWEGTIEIPGLELKAIVDLSRSEAAGWVGSITLPGLGIKGAELTDITASNSALGFAMKEALLVKPSTAATFKGNLDGAGIFQGSF